MATSGSESTRKFSIVSCFLFCGVIFIVFLGLAYSGFLTALSKRQYYTSRPVDEILQELGITQSDYTTLPVCEKVHAYITVGSYNLNLDHGIVNVPDWIEFGLNRHTSADVLNCLLEEGEEQLDLWPTKNSDHERLSYVLLAVFLTLNNKNLDTNERSMEFMRRAYCDYPIYHGNWANVILYNKLGGEYNEEMTLQNFERIWKKRVRFICEPIH